MEMLSSATKMDIFPTFLQSEKDFDEDFNYITSSGTTLGEMLSTENFLESYGYDSKSPDDIFAEDVVYETNDFVSIIKQETGFEYPDYQMNTSPESEMSSYEDQLQLVNTSNDLMSVDLEYLLNMQKASTAKQENENVVVKVEAVESNLLTDESVPVLNHEASAETSTNNGLQYLFEGGIVKAEKEFEWKAGFEDIDCVVPSLFMDATSGHHASSEVIVKSEPTVKNDVTSKREVVELSTKSLGSKSVGNASTEEVIVGEIVRRTQTDTSGSVKNSDSKRSAPEIEAKSNKKLKKPVDSEDGEERLKKAVNNVKLRQQKKFDEGRLREQKRREEEFQKNARERAQYFSKQIASGAIQMKSAEEKEEKKAGCLQKKRGRKLKAASSPEGPSNVNDMPVAPPSSATSSSSSKVNALSDLSSKSSSKGSAVQLTTQQPSNASLVISTSQQQVKSIINSSVSKRSPKVNVVLTSSAASELCQTKAISTTSVKRSPSTSSLPISLCRSESSASPHQVDSLGSFPSKRSPTVNDVSSVVASSVSSPVTTASCLLMKTDGSLVQSTTAAAIPTKVNTLSAGVSCGKMSSILNPFNKRPQRPLAISVAKGGVSILKSSAAHTSLAVANSASKPFSASSSSANTLVTYAAKAQTSLLKMPIMAGASVLRAPTPTQLQNLLPNEVNSIRFHQGRCPGVQPAKFVSVSAAVAQNSTTLMTSSSGQKPWTGINKTPIVISGNACPPDIVKSEAGETMIERQLVAENNTSRILKQEPEIKQNFPVDVKTELIDDYANQSSQSSTTGAGLLTESSQDGNNNEKKKENKKRLNVSEYMNRLKERSRNELSETKPQATNEGLGTSAIKPRVTNENLDGNYSVLDEHNYCIRSEQRSNDLPSQRINSSESNVLTSSKMIFSASDGTIFRLKARTSTPASVTSASTVNEKTSSSRPVPSAAATNDHRSRQPVTHSSCSSLVVPVKNSVSGKISSDVTTSFDVRRQTSVSGKVACAANSTSGRQWKLIPHNLQVTLVSFRDAIGQKVISSNGHQSHKLGKADLNQVEIPLLPSATCNAGNVSAFDCESSRPSKVISGIEVASQEEEEFNSCQSFSGASGSQSAFSTSPENSIVDQSGHVVDSVADSLPIDQLLSSSSSCALTSVSAEKTTQSSVCALSSSASTDRDKMRRTRRTSRNRRLSRSSKSSRSSSSDSCRSRSPIRQHRRSRDESSSSSYCSRSPSRQRNRRDYRRNSRYNRYERKWQSDDFMSDNKDKVREKKIYVGGIPDDCTPLELKERFQHFGEITKVSVHPQTEQENYGFLTFRYTNDALRLKEEGHKVTGCEGFHFCYGDRRSFCKEDYKDFDNMWSQSWDVDVGYHAKPKQSEDAAFEDMLKAHLRDQRRKNP